MTFIEAHDALSSAHPVRPLGYVSSGQFAADAKMQEAREHFRRFCIARRDNDKFWQRHHWLLAVLSYRSARNLQHAVRHYE